MSGAAAVCSPGIEVAVVSGAGGEAAFGFPPAARLGGAATDPVAQHMSKIKLAW